MQEIHIPAILVSEMQTASGWRICRDRQRRKLRKTYGAAGKKPFTALTKGSQLTAQKSDKLSYGVGDRVRHVKFGEGTVLDIKEGGRDFEVTVEFDTAGVRKMFAMFAKLVKI